MLEPIKLFHLRLLNKEQTVNGLSGTFFQELNESVSETSAVLLGLRTKIVIYQNNFQHFYVF